MTFGSISRYSPIPPHIPAIHRSAVERVNFFMAILECLCRVIWVIVTVLSGFLPGIIIYILLWILLPEEGQARPVGTYSEA
jgi:hypothetical protein